MFFWINIIWVMKQEIPQVSQILLVADAISLALVHLVIFTSLAKAGSAEN